MAGQLDLLAFNRGLMSRLALARLDLKRTAMSAETQTNFIPLELGPMMLRPGLGYVGSVASTTHRIIPFVFASDDTALVEVSAGKIRVWSDHELVTSGDAAASVTNGTFDSNLTGWTDADEVGGTSAWVTGGYMGLTGDGDSSAIRYQEVTVTSADEEHRVQIVVTRGPVMLRIGSTSSADDFFSESTLGVGTHNLAFTPTANFFIQLSNREDWQARVDSVSVYAADTVVEVAAPWTADDMSALQWFQSGDVIYVACYGKQQYKIERRSNNSWSVVKYSPVDGPFRVQNITPTTIDASALTGSVTLTASDPIFKSTNVGGLYRLESVGQTVTDTFTAENDFSNTIRVIGIGEGRRFALVLTGTFTATLTLQQSFDEGSTWQDAEAYTAPESKTVLDALDNQIVYYRVGVKTGEYTSGTLNATLQYSAGSIVGVARVTAFSSETSVTADVLAPIGSMVATPNWSEGAWSERRGWPSSVVIHDGRLFFAGKDNVWGSITDAFESFDPDFEGDAGPILRSIGFGPVEKINWLVSLNRMVAGTASSEITFRSTSFDEPLTPTNFTPKETGTQGSSAVHAIKVDGHALFVQRCGSRVMNIAFDVAQNDFVTEDLTKISPDIGSPGITRMVVQRQPDTRVHCVRSDGTVAMLLFNKAENLICWVEIETATDDLILDVAVLPGVDEDEVYYTVQRDGTAYLEKWALQSEARGAAVTKLADGFVYAADSSSTISGLSHLEGREVVLWGNGKDQGVATVVGGVVSFPEPCTNRCAGLGYTAQFKSTKLAYMVQQGKSGIGARKRIHKLGVILCDTHYQGLQYGPAFDRLDDMPLVEQWTEQSDDTVHTDYEEPLFEFPGEWSTDSRLCLQAQAPRPCTVLAAVIDMEVNPK